MSIYTWLYTTFNLKQALERTTLKNQRYIIKPGKYSRALSFTEAVESIKDPNAIVVTVDLQLDIGSQFINDVCKVRRSEINMCLDLGPVSVKSR